MYLVFDVGGTFVKYAYMTIDGEIKEKGKYPTPDSNKQDVSEFVESLGRVYDSFKEKGVEGIAMSMPGLIDTEHGFIRNGGALKYLKDVALGDLLSKRCDGIRISMENDAKCAALAEVWMGNAKGCKNAAVVILGTGIGGGIVINGRVHRGNDLSAGELSYIFSDFMTRKNVDRIFDLDSIHDMEEEYEKLPFLWATSFSTRAFCYQVAIAKGINPKEFDGEKLYQLAEEGDPVVVDMLEDFYFMTAKNLFAINAIVDPDIILLGGGISAQPKFIEGVKRYVEKMRKISMISNFIHVDVCKFGNDSNLLGALYTFRQMHLENKQ